MNRTQHRPSPAAGTSAGQNLASGAAGRTLLHIERAHRGLVGSDVVQNAVVAMTREPINPNPANSSFYRGAPAVAFVLHTAGQPGYAKALATLDEQVAAITRHRLCDAHERVDCGQLPALREFDLISGLTGLGAYLLHRQCRHELLNDVLRYLVRLSEPVRIDGQPLPGWWSSRGPTDQYAPEWPGGHGNLGIAHGIAGPLALLATTMRRGVTVAGQAEAITRIIAWLDQWQCGVGLRAWWPGVISRTELRRSAVEQCGPQRPSWCYGMPGLVRAQQLAAIALDDDVRQRHAEEALLGCIDDEAQLSQLIDAGLCHGWAGLVQGVARIAADATCDVAAGLPRLLRRFEQMAADTGQLDDGLVDGTAGIELARMTAAHGPSLSGWDACLLLAG